MLNFESNSLFTSLRILIWDSSSAILLFSRLFWDLFSFSATALSFYSSKFFIFICYYSIIFFSSTNSRYNYSKFSFIFTIFSFNYCFSYSYVCSIYSLFKCYYSSSSSLEFVAFCNYKLVFSKLSLSKLFSYSICLLLVSIFSISYCNCYICYSYFDNV